MNRTYRKPIIAGNWKMNKTVGETTRYAQALKPLLPESGLCEIVLCPPALCIPALETALRETCVAVGAQNMHAAEAGAYTGEISPAMLAEAGCQYVIVGHSERRAMGESDGQVNEKVLAAIAHGLRPIICVGESAAQREAGLTQAHITAQVTAALTGLTDDGIGQCVIAYEPIWAIGTGNTATPEQAAAVCGLIRAVIGGICGGDTARAVPILYGGSMNEQNAAGLLAQEDIDGGLIGGASLIPEKFVKIISAANRIQAEANEEDMPNETVS